ncbi:MAG: peptide-methionine (S)-S-oxide reductase MsrA [Myxococcales bacterium]|nr:peptide-methionine (S)-S-oxide reductase MsrA [Myxococcales bacterium]
MFFARSKPQMPSAAEALADRDAVIAVAPRHAALGTRTLEPWPEGLALAMFGMGCFWGAERKFWRVAGVYSTQVGYAGGFTRNATYRDVCSGRTGHNEVVRVVYDPAKVSYAQLLKVFWESHDPTQGMRQGNDLGTQYRSGVYAFTAAQRHEAEASRAAYEAALAARGLGPITTEIVDAPPFYYAEDDHQQYLEKNPDGYCGLGGTGVSCPVGLGG